MTILIIDEDKRNMPSFINNMDALGCTCYQARTSLEAQEYLMRQKPDAIILDMMMPALGVPEAECFGGYTTGFHIYKTVVKPKALGVPFIVMSATVSEADAIEPIKQALAELATYDGYRGQIDKVDPDCTPETILKMLTTRKGIE